MYLTEKERALNQILEKIYFLENEVGDALITYYISFPAKINGITLETTIYEIFQLLIYDYKNIVLKDYYDELKEKYNNYS